MKNNDKQGTGIMRLIEQKINEKPRQRFHLCCTGKDHISKHYNSNKYENQYPYEDSQVLIALNIPVEIAKAVRKQFMNKYKHAKNGGMRLTQGSSIGSANKIECINLYLFFEVKRLTVL